MAISDRILMKMTKTRLKLSDLNPHLMCVLCGGYYIDATTIVECLHSFCRSCIVKHLEGSKYCPICEVQVHKTKPLINIRPDKTLQDIVYKLVPGLFASEMQNRRVFYQERPHYIKPNDSESVGEISNERVKMFVEGENVTFSLNYLSGPSPVPIDDKYKEVTTIQSELRYFRCPLGVSIHHLKKLLKAKYELRGNNYVINIFFKDTNLNDDYTLLDISYIFLWVNEDNLSMTFKIYECPIKRRRRRYFGGVDELPAHFTPLSILQSRLGIIGDSLAENSMLEGRRHLRSDIEKKKREIERKIQEERRLSERELRSHDEKKKDKDTKNNDLKKKERKKDGKHGEDKKKEMKTPDEKKKKKDRDKEGRLSDDQHKEKDDKEDKDEKRKDKEAKGEKKETKKEGENKRKREGEREEKRKREKRDDTKEKNVDKREEVKEDVCEKSTSEEDWKATATETAPTEEVSASTSAENSASVSTSALERTSEANSEQALEKDLEPVSTTDADSKQETEEATMTKETPVTSDSTSFRENGAAPLKVGENSEVQLQISETGVMSMLPIPDNSGDLKKVEEPVCVRVTRRSSITGAPPREDDTGVRKMKKRGPKPKKDRLQNAEGISKNPGRKVSQKPTKVYKTIRRSPIIWHPSIPREKLRPTLLKNMEETKRPAKFFKLRNRSRAMENPSNDAKPKAGEPAAEEGEQMPRRETEKEQAPAESQKAHAGIGDESNVNKIEEEKGQLEEEMKRNEEGEKREVGEEDKELEATSTAKEDPKTLETIEEENSNMVGVSDADPPTNLNGGQQSFGSQDKEDRSSNIVGSSASNLLTNPFIPNSNHFLFSNVTLPPNSGNLSKSAESNHDKPGLGKGGASGAKHGVNCGRGSGNFKNSAQNGVNCSPMCFLDPCRLVLPYHAYPLRERDSYLQTTRMTPFGNMNMYNPVGGFDAGLPPSIKHLSSPHQNHGVGLGSGRKNKDDSTKEKNRCCDDATNPNKAEDKERKKRRRRVETETTNFLKMKGTGKESKTDGDANAGDEEEDDDAIFVPAKRKRDEKGSRDKERKEENGGKKDKPKEDKAEKDKEKGEKKKGEEGVA